MTETQTETLPATFAAVGEVILAPEGWRTPDWFDQWHAILRETVASDNPWGLYGQRADGDIRLFGCDPQGIQSCSEFATWAVRLVQRTDDRDV
jgi:hypothetical protein